MTADDDHPQARMLKALRPDSIDDLLRGLQAMEEYFGEIIDRMEVVDRDSAIELLGYELELSLTRRMRQAVESEDPCRIRRVLRLVAHRSFGKPWAPHAFVKPVYSFFSDRGFDLGDMPRSSLARRLSELGGCLLVSMSVCGVVAAVIALVMREFAIAAVLAIVALTGWAGMKLYSRETIPREFPRRLRDSESLDRLIEDRM